VGRDLGQDLERDLERDLEWDLELEQELELQEEEEQQQQELIKRRRRTRRIWRRNMFAMVCVLTFERVVDNLVYILYMVRPVRRGGGGGVVKPHRGHLVPDHHSQPSELAGGPRLAGARPLEAQAEDVRRDRAGREQQGAAPARHHHEARGLERGELRGVAPRSW
jgi:hypothetical protein